MRDYEFRGKRLDNGEWVYGSLTVRLVDGYLDHSKKCYFIQYDYMNNYGQVFTDKFEVDSSTIGQFTGLYDKNEVKIYDGDIVEAWSQGLKAIGEVKQRIDGLWLIYPAWQSGEFWGLMPNYIGETTVKIIGNIHDKENK